MRKINQSKRQMSKRKTSKRQMSKRKTSKRQKPRRSRKFKMTNDENDDENGENNVFRMLIITRNVANLKGRDKEMLSRLEGNKQRIIRNMELLQNRMRNMDDVSTSDAEKKLLENEILENALEFKWLEYHIRKLDEHIDKTYEKILEDEFILPIVGRYVDDNKVINHIIEIKNREINDFLEDQRRNKDTIKALFLDETLQSIENFSNRYFRQRYFENADNNEYYFSNFLKDLKIKNDKRAKSPYRKRTKELKSEIQTRQLGLIEKIMLTNKSYPEVTTSHSKILKKRQQN